MGGWVQGDPKRGDGMMELRPPMSRDRATSRASKKLFVCRLPWKSKHIIVAQSLLGDAENRSPVIIDRERRYELWKGYD